MSHLKFEDNVLPRGRSLFDEYFEVRFIQSQGRSIEDMRSYAQRVSGVPIIDTAMKNNWVYSEFSIDMMFERWKKGATIKVVNYRDTARIFKIIESHLHVWMDYLQTGVNLGASPIEELLELDEFANTVYDKARNIMTKSFLKKHVPQAFSAGSITLDNILINTEVPRVEEMGADRDSFKKHLENHYSWLRHRG